MRNRSFSQKKNHASARLAAACFAGSLLLSGCGETSTDSYLAAALGKMEREEFLPAARLLETAIEKDPANATAFANLGLAYDRMGRTGPAITALSRAAELCPADPRPLEWLGHIYLRTTKYPEARKAFEQAHQRCLVSPKILTSLALVEFQAGEFPASVAYLNKALAIDPTCAPALFNLARLRANDPRQRAETIKLFKRFLQAMEPADPADPHVKTARAFLERGTRPPSAATPAPARPGAAAPDRAPAPPPQPTPVATPAPAARLAPPAQPAPVTTVAPPPAPAPRREEVAPLPRPVSPAAPLLESARAAIQTESYEEALILLKDAVEKDTKNPDALWELVQLYRRLPMLNEEAERTIRLFKLRFPYDSRLSSVPGGLSADAKPKNPAKPQAPQTREAVTWSAKGLESFRKGDFDEARHHYRRAVELDPNLAGAWYNLGLLYHRNKKEANQAKQAFDKALELQPGLTGASFMLAMLAWEQKNKEQAVAQFKKTLAMEPGYARAHFMLGVIYRETGEPAKASDHLGQFLRLAPDDSHAEQARSWLKTLPAT